MKIRNVGFILLGIVVLVLKSHYSGPLMVLVHSYAGNVAVSFAVYFLAIRLQFKNKLKRLLTVIIALAVVELFEVSDGFGIMGNVYDDLDLVANILGVMLGYTIDAVFTFRQRMITNGKKAAI